MELEREKREIVIYLPNCKVEGFVELMKGVSLTEWMILNPQGFIRVDDATVTAIRAHETWKYRVAAISINKDYIVNVFSRKNMRSIQGKNKR